MKHLRTVAAAALVIALSACAAGSGASQEAAQSGTIAQAALGFWHGLIAPLTLISEIIQEIAPGVLPWEVRFYEKEGTGVLYDVGFFIGLISGPSLLWTGASRRR